MIGIEVFFPLGRRGIHNLAKDAIFNTLIDTTPDCPSKNDMFIENKEAQCPDGEIWLKIRELKDLSLLDYCGYMTFCCSLIETISVYVGDDCKKIICHFNHSDGDVTEIAVSTKKQNKKTS